jgi:hypothetical protein
MIYLFGFIAFFVIIDLLKGYFSTKKKSIYLKKNLIGLLIVVIILFLFGPFFIISPIKLGYSSLRKNNLTVFFPSSAPDTGKEIFEEAKRAIKANEEFYKISYDTSILVALTPFDMLRFGSPPEAGGTDNELGIIISEDKANEGLITQEISHRYLALFTKKTPIFSVPRWFDEGLASYLGKMDYYKKPTELKIDLEEGQYHTNITRWQGYYGLIRWLDMTFINRNPRLIYGQSYQMVKYLFDKYGSEAVYQILLTFREVPFDKAFYMTLGITPEEFHQRFIDYIKI